MDWSSCFPPTSGVQFATGYGLEGILPDAICKRIQNRYMLPYFKDKMCIRDSYKRVDGERVHLMQFVRFQKAADGTFFAAVEPQFNGVLVVSDMLGMTNGFSPRFLRRYADLHTVMTGAIQQYVEDVKKGDFPNEDEQY